jgi:hypothetical protein
MQVLRRHLAQQLAHLTLQTSLRYSVDVIVSIAFTSLALREELRFLGEDN